MKQSKRLELLVGYKCNNNCLFCIISGERNWWRTHGDNLSRSYDELKEKILKAKGSGITKINFNGGEPTIHPQIIKLIYYAKSLGFDEIFMTSNGKMFYYKHFCELVIDAGLNGVLFSLHGHNAELHDHLTQSPGSFDQIIQGIKNLKEIRDRQHLNFQIWNNTTITKTNFRFLSEISNLLINLGVDFYQFTFVNPMGNAWDNKHEMIPRVSDTIGYIKKALDVGVKRDVCKPTIEGLPVCFFKGYEKYIAEFYMPAYWEYDSQEKKILDFNEHRKNEGKTKSSSCRKCKYNLICEGIWNNYVEIFGFDEFIPVKGKYIKDPRTLWADDQKKKHIVKSYKQK